MPAALPYRLGCPAWSVPEWRGRFLPQATPQRDFLRHYARVFHTVEGNSMFYALPKMEIVLRWIDEVGPEFRFCPKVPRDVSHGEHLPGAPGVLQAFWERLECLAEARRLGPSFLQLPARFGLAQLEELSAFLEAWPRQFPLAVEVRHPVFFEGGAEEENLNARLIEHGADRVIFDSRSLFSAAPGDAVEVESQKRKPRLPVRWQALGRHPMVRFVGRNRVDDLESWLDDAAQAVAGWITEGRCPHVFMHTPDDVMAPQLCALFHERLRRWIPGLPSVDLTAASGPQLELFS